MNASVIKTAVLELDGAQCTSCAIAIEHAGKHLAGVEDVFVNRGESTIEVHYSGDPVVLEQICDFVRRIGYEASVRATG